MNISLNKIIQICIDAVSQIWIIGTVETQQRAENEMTDKQLAEQEARELAEQRDEQAKRMEQAMRAVNEVSKQHNRTAMTYGVSK